MRSAVRNLEEGRDGARGLHALAAVLRRAGAIRWLGRQHCLAGRALVVGWSSRQTGLIQLSSRSRVMIPATRFPRQSAGAEAPDMFGRSPSRTSRRSLRAAALSPTSASRLTPQAKTFSEAACDRQDASPVTVA